MTDKQGSVRVTDAVISAIELAEDRRKAVIVLCASLAVVAACWYLKLSFPDAIASRTDIPEIDARDAGHFNVLLHRGWLALTLLAPMLATYAALNLLVKPLPAAAPEPEGLFVGRIADEARQARTRWMMISSGVVGALHASLMSLWGK